MTSYLRVAPGVLVVAAVAATAPFALLLAYALVWSAYTALDVPGTVATWLSFASVSVVPAYAGRTAARAVAYMAPNGLEPRLLRVPELPRPTVSAPRVATALGVVAGKQDAPPPGACETTTEIPPFRDVPPPGHGYERLVDLDRLSG